MRWGFIVIAVVAWAAPARAGDAAWLGDPMFELRAMDWHNVQDTPRLRDQVTVVLYGDGRGRDHWAMIDELRRLEAKHDLQIVYMELDDRAPFDAELDLGWPVGTGAESFPTPLVDDDQQPHTFVVRRDGTIAFIGHDSHVNTRRGLRRAVEWSLMASVTTPQRAVARRPFDLVVRVEATDYLSLDVTQAPTISVDEPEGVACEEPQQVALSQDEIEMRVSCTARSAGTEIIVLEVAFGAGSREHTDRLVATVEVTKKATKAAR